MKGSAKDNQFQLICLYLSLVLGHSFLQGNHFLTYREYRDIMYIYSFIKFTGKNLGKANQAAEVRGIQLLCCARDHLREVCTPRVVHCGVSTCTTSDSSSEGGVGGAAM